MPFIATSYLLEARTHEVDRFDAVSSRHEHVLFDDLGRGRLQPPPHIRAAPDLSDGRVEEFETVLGAEPRAEALDGFVRPDYLERTSRNETAEPHSGVEARREPGEVTTRQRVEEHACGRPLRVCCGVHAAV